MIRVLVVDDSLTSRLLLTAIIDSDPGMQVVATAADGEEAVRLCRELRPDLVTMDLYMPGIDGYEATRRIMAQCPTPIVVISAGVDAGALQSTFAILEAGALTALPKPPSPESPGFAASQAGLLNTLRLMADVKVVGRRPPRERPAVRPELRPVQRVELVAVGASTGGPSAICRLLRELPAGFPAPLLVVQHMATGFAAGLAQWLGSQSHLPVGLVTGPTSLEPGRVYLAADQHHLVVTGRGRADLRAAAPQELLRPSADQLFRSVARFYGSGAVGVLLTGMGSDGAEGLLAMRQAAALTLAQDEATCAVYGMPGAAVALGAVERVLPLDQIAPALLRLVSPAPR